MAADYKAIVSVIPKEGLTNPSFGMTREGLANPSFGMTMTKILKDAFGSTHVMFLLSSRGVQLKSPPPTCC